MSGFHDLSQEAQQEYQAQRIQFEQNTAGAAYIYVTQDNSDLIEIDFTRNPLIAAAIDPNSSSYDPNLDPDSIKKFFAPNFMSIGFDSNGESIYTERTVATFQPSQGLYQDIVTLGQTDQKFDIFEFLIPPEATTSFHTHLKGTELFYVLGGDPANDNNPNIDNNDDVVFELNADADGVFNLADATNPFSVVKDEQIEINGVKVTKGSFVSVPAGKIHTWSNTGSIPARVIALIVPGGIAEGFNMVGAPAGIYDPSPEVHPILEANGTNNLVPTGNTATEVTGLVPADTDFYDFQKQVATQPEVLDLLGFTNFPTYIEGAGPIVTYGISADGSGAFKIDPSDAAGVGGVANPEGGSAVVGDDSPGADQAVSAPLDPFANATFENPFTVLRFEQNDGVLNPTPIETNLFSISAEDGEYGRVSNNYELFGVLSGSVTFEFGNEDQHHIQTASEGDYVYIQPGNHFHLSGTEDGANLIQFSGLVSQTPVNTNTLTFPATTYNLNNGLNPDLDYGQVVNGMELPGVITTYPNGGPQEYLNILVNPSIDQGIPSPTIDAPYGLTNLVGSVYLYDVWTPDPNNPGKYIYQSSQATTNPDDFPFLQENYPELEPGYITLEGSGPNKLFGTERADITSVTENGVVHITSVGTIDIIGGEGLFAGATGTLTFHEEGISGLPYLGTTTITGDIQTKVPLLDSYIIGQENFDSWSQGFDPNGYLKVLPHPDVKVEYKDPFLQWQQDHLNGQFKEAADDGSYYSSWGPDQVLEVTLNMDELEQLVIEGFGTLKQGDHLIDWLNKATPYDILRAYNERITGPMLIVDPGDTIKITLNNNLADVSNLHTHGLHVSPLGHQDNVLITTQPGESWEYEIKVPEDHFIGADWYHPHFHGETNEQVASGLGGYLLINPPYDLPDLDKRDPVTSPAFFMALQSFGIQQVDRPSSPTDPLNQSSDPNVVVPAGTPLLNNNGVYTLSDAPFVGYNGKGAFYNPEYPLGNPPPNQTTAYGEGSLAEPVENVIHTINGQYNPTLDIQTGQWDLFSFANMTVNSFHVIQLVKLEADGTLTPQTMQLVAIDGDAAGVVEGIRREVTETPILNPGSRISVQNWFEEPGTYYFLSNATDEVLGDDAPSLTKDGGFNDGHLIWGSQVLATVEVTGEAIATGAFPEVYDVLKQQSDHINEMINGEVTQERTFTWSANVGGALFEGNIPDDTKVSTFEGTYRINGEYFATEGGGMPPLTMPMLGTTETWTLKNTSGISDELYAQMGIDIPLLEWHPFHIHQNDFVVTEINGIPVEDIEDTYLPNVLSDTIALPPSYAPGSVTPQNPYGTPQVNGTPSEVKIMMEFADYPGAYVNHCHILFHEDAGMMAVVRVILNTDDTWLSLGATQGSSLELFKASNTEDNLTLNAYNTAVGVDVAIADVNFKTGLGEGNTNVTDNVTDVVTIQRQLTSVNDEFTIKVFDGKRLLEAQQGLLEINNLYQLNNTGEEFSPDFARADVLATTVNGGYGLNRIEGSTYLLRNVNTGEFAANSDPLVLGKTNPPYEPQQFEISVNETDKLFGAESSQGIVNPDLTVDNQGMITIMGGEGKFVGATGQLYFVEKGGFTQTGYQGTLDVTGTINVTPKEIINGDDPDIFLAQIKPFVNTQPTLEQKTSVAAGDINGDGFADIVAAIGGGMAPIIEIYSGQDYQLMGTLNPFHHDDFTGTVNIAVGDINGDNFADILVAQGEGGTGQVEAYSGIILDGLIRSGEISNLTGVEVAHQSAMLTKVFQPYGANYTGEVDITSGYVLQTPEFPNGAPVQTAAANITTLALGELPEGEDTVKIHTFMGAAHSHDHSTAATTTENAEVEVQKSFTPDSEMEQITGTFADVLGERGQSVLFGKDKNGGHQLIDLKVKNEQAVVEKQELFLGDNDVELTNNLEKKYTVFTGQSHNTINNNSSSAAKDGIYAGLGNDVLYAGINDRLFGGEDDDILDARNAGSGNHLFGGEGDDLLYAGNGHNILVGGAGADTLIMADGALPNQANTVLDFETGDKIGIMGLTINDQAVTFGNVDITESTRGIEVGISELSEQPFAIFLGVTLAAINQESNFQFS